MTVYNRTRAKAEALVAQGAKAAAGVSDTCRGDAVITMLANDYAVENAPKMRSSLRLRSRLNTLKR